MLPVAGVSYHMVVAFASLGSSCVSMLGFTGFPCAPCCRNTNMWAEVELDKPRARYQVCVLRAGSHAGATLLVDARHASLPAPSIVSLQPSRWTAGECSHQL